MRVWFAKSLRSKENVMKRAFTLAFVCALLIALGSPLRAETIAGRVVGPDGAPIAATVFYAPADGWWTGKSPVSVQAGADGTFQFEIEPAPSMKTSAALPVNPANRGGAAAFAPGLSLGMAKLKASGANLIKLPPQRKIGGVLRDDKGALVAGAVIDVKHFFWYSGSQGERESIFFPTPPSLLGQFTTQTDAKGAWELAGVPAQGGVHVHLDDDNYVGASVQIDAEDERSGPSRRTLVARRAGSISGRVLNEKGLPAENVSIVAASATQADNFPLGGFAKTGKDGVFRITRLTPGTYNVLVSNGFGGYAPYITKREATPDHAAPAIENVRVEAGKATENNHFRLVKAARIKGRVFDRKTSKPLEGVSVGAWGKASPRSAGLQPSSVSDAQGRYELASMPGDNEIYAYQQDMWGREKTAEPKPVAVSLRAGENKTQTLWVESRFADLRGTVVEENGAPVNGIEISLLNTSGSGLIFHSDAKGKFQRKRLLLGAWHLDSTSEWTIVSPKAVALPLGEDEQVQIVVRRNAMAKVSGRIVDASGKPIEGVKLTFEMPIKTPEGQTGEGWSSELNAQSDETGLYVFDKLKMPEALKLKMITAHRDGYKLRQNASVPPGATAKDTALQLSDVVMNRLAREIKGVVHNSDGKPMEGALVRSSGDDYETLATTDAQGRFALANQPDGEVELLAAHEYSFGSAKSSFGSAKSSFGSAKSSGETKLTLRKGTPPPVQDIARATALFREMAPNSDHDTLKEAAKALAPHDPAAALELLMSVANTRPNAARRQVIIALDHQASDKALAWAQQELPKIESDSEFVESAVMLGLALSARQPDAAKATFETANARAAKLPAVDLVEKARVAALAARLNLPVAPILLETFLVEARKNADTAASLVVPLALGTADAAQRILDVLPSDRENNIFNYRQAIEQIARYDAPGALKMLETMRLMVDAVPELPDVNGHLAGRSSREFDWAFAAKAVMRGLDRADAATAQNIAQRVKLWHRPSALGLAAEFGTREQRLAQAQATVADESRGDWMKNITMPRMGALVADLDADAAAQMFDQTLKSLDSQRRERGDSSYSDWGFYAGFWNPAAARLILEAQWRRTLERGLTPNPDPNVNIDWAKSPLAKAMSSIDVDRAVDLARQVSDEISLGTSSQRARVLAFIGESLLAPPAKRRLMVIGSESGFDN